MSTMDSIASLPMPCRQVVWSKRVRGALWGSLSHGSQIHTNRSAWRRTVFLSINFLMDIHRCTGICVYYFDLLLWNVCDDELPTYHYPRSSEQFITILIAPCYDQFYSKVNSDYCSGSSCKSWTADIICNKRNIKIIWMELCMCVWVCDVWKTCALNYEASIFDNKFDATN